MYFNDLVNEFWRGILSLSYLEITGVVFGLLSVWYSKKENILVFPTGIVSVIVYMYICFYAKLYADMGINVVYFVMSIYGWMVWSRKENNETLPITICTRTERNICGLSIPVIFVVIYFILISFTDSDVPLWDSLTTSIFLVGMWLMARKKLENWIMWIVGNAISIPLYFYKGLILTSFQFTIFLVLAIMGYYSWKISMLKRSQIVTT
jgi:nicotinamide mononucleotide transporter